jgi:hypothetical protein
LIDQFSGIVSFRLIKSGVSALAPDVGDIMRHNWIIDVLADLRSYAEVNNLPDIALAAQQALDVAAAEISAVAGSESNGLPCRIVPA